jgi:hypothetical protein
MNRNRDLCAYSYNLETRLFYSPGTKVRYLSIAIPTSEAAESMLSCYRDATYRRADAYC